MAQLLHPAGGILHLKQERLDCFSGLPQFSANSAKPLRTLR